jgi:hypothetical protein
MGGATAAASALNINNVLAASTTTTPFFAKGLVMVSFEDPKFLRLGFPNAPGHRGTLAVLPKTGSKRSLSLKGNTTLEGSAVGSAEASRFVIPEIVRMKEFYGDSIRSRIAECPTVVRIPYTAIQSIAAVELSPVKYTFLRRDTGTEVPTFRVRKIAESIRIELASDSVIHMDNGKTLLELKNFRELRAEFAPENPPTNLNVDPFAVHFGHYFTYLDRPATANFEVVPQRIGEVKSSVPKAGNSFAAFYPYYECFLVQIP